MLRASGFETGRRNTNKTVWWVRVADPRKGVRDVRVDDSGFEVWFVQHKPGERCSFANPRKG